AVALAKPAIQPEDTQEVTWQVAGDAAGLETVIQLQQPGNVYPEGGSRNVRPGDLPATGTVSDLTADGSFTSAPTAYATGQGAGDTTFHLPEEAQEGEWQAAVLLRDPATGRFLTAGAADFLVSASPSILLHVDRTLANTTDAVHAELLTTAGRTP